MHGKGKLVSIEPHNDYKYIGQFADNVYEGEGILRTGDPCGLGGGKLHYAGQFHCGIREGTGEL